MLVNLPSPEPVVEVLHGIAVKDPYRWLEDRSSSDTEAWIAAQECHINDYFSRLQGMGFIRRRVEHYLNVESVEQPTRIGDRCLFRRRRVGDEQARIWMRHLPSGIETVLVDPSPLGPFVAVTIRWISDDGTLLAYEQRDGGERTATIRFVHVDSGCHLDEHLQNGYLRGMAFDQDNSGFFYSHEPRQYSDLCCQHEIRYHRIGTPIAYDSIVFSIRRTERSRLTLISDDSSLGAILSYEEGDEVQVDLFRAARSSYRKWSCLTRANTAPYAPFFDNGRIYVFSCVSAPSGQILELQQDGTEGLVIVPEWKVPIRSLRQFGNKLFVSYLLNLETIIHIWSLDGEFLGRLSTPKDGTFTLARQTSSCCGSLFGMHEAFHQPPLLLEYEADLGAYHVWPESSSNRSIDSLEVKRASYPSSDGTTIPMYLVTSKECTPSTPHPGLLTAYGGYGICMTPRFSVLVAIMLEVGAVFALPNIRGGGEFGASWHEAARGRRRQVAIDDFISAAKWLRDQNITCAEQLAILGGSHSGLLVAAAMTQYPDLFRAVLCIAPILDMIRYEQFGDAAKSRVEYGTVSDPEDFNALLAYSPYHHVTDDVNYPATMLVSGDKDTVCDPAHTRKMGARLQERHIQSNTILVDYTAERGHTAALPLSVRVDALTRRIAFLCDQLNINVPKEDTFDPAHS